MGGGVEGGKGIVQMGRGNHVEQSKMDLMKPKKSVPCQVPFLKHLLCKALHLDCF